MESDKVDDVIARMDYVDIPATVSNIRDYYLSDEGYKQIKKGKAESVNWVQRIRKGFNIAVNRERKKQGEAY